MSRPLNQRATLVGLPDVGVYAPAGAAVRNTSSRKWGALGDSITHGSTAGAGRRFIDQLPKITGTSYLSTESYVEAGVPGNNTASMRARYKTDIRATGVRTLFLLCGTNDIQQSRTVQDWSADVMAIAAMAKQDGIPLIIGTVPPRGTSAVTTTTRKLTDQYNLWLNLWAPSQGIYVADVWSSLLAGGSSDMLSGYDSGDGIHPNTLGHQRIAQAFATAFNSVPTVTPFFMTGVGTQNICSNPTLVGAGTKPNGWFERTGGTGTAPTYTLAADSSGFITHGQMMTMDFDATASGGTRYVDIPCSSTGWAPGDTLIAFAKVKYVDITGGFAANAGGDAPNATLAFYATNSSNNIAIKTCVNNSVLSPGPIAASFVVPAGIAGINLALRMTLPTGQHTQALIGEVGLFNLSAAGLASLV
jgi:lysophospholipase L1-like esterase